MPNGPQDFKNEPALFAWLDALGKEPAQLDYRTARLTVENPQAAKVYEDLKDAIAEIAIRPKLLTDRVLGALTAVALNSPYDDIHEGDGLKTHRQLAGQMICAIVIENMIWLMDAPENEPHALLALEDIAARSRDWDMRREAIYALWHVAEGPEDEAVNEIALGALERICAGDYYAARMLARDRLQDIAKKKPEVFATALKAQLQGAQDNDLRARREAFGMLGNMVQSLPEFGEKELSDLCSVFKKAVFEERAAGVRAAADRGLSLTQERLARPGMAPAYPVPKRNPS